MRRVMVNGLIDIKCTETHMRAYNAHKVYGSLYTFESSICFIDFVWLCGYSTAIPFAVHIQFELGRFDTVSYTYTPFILPIAID